MFNTLTEVLYVFVVIIWNGTYEEQYPREWGLTWNECQWLVETHTESGSRGTCLIDEYATKRAN